MTQLFEHLLHFYFELTTLISNKLPINCIIPLPSNDLWNWVSWLRDFTSSFNRVEIKHIFINAFCASSNLWFVTHVSQSSSTAVSANTFPSKIPKFWFCRDKNCRFTVSKPDELETTKKIHSCTNAHTHTNRRRHRNTNTSTHLCMVQFHHHTDIDLPLLECL